MAGLAVSLGSGAMSDSFAGVDKTDCLLVTGSNTTETHPLIAAKIRRAVERRGVKLIVVDPRRVGLVRNAHIWLRPRPGTDVAWINGMLHVIFSEDLWDRDFVAIHCDGMDEVRRIVSAYTPERVQQITGIPADDLIRAARCYGEAERAMIFYAMGITQHEHGTDNVKSLANLCLACGQFGRAGTGVNPLRGQNNVQGACDLGALPNVFPGYAPVDAREVRERFQKSWNPGFDLSARPGLCATEMFPGVLQGSVKAMYIMGENPVLSDPDVSHVSDALRVLDFLVVQDIFMTETARYAHVILPGISFAEKNGTFTNAERRVQRVRRAIAPLNGFRAEWKMIVELAARMVDREGNRDALYSWKYDSAWEIFEEIRGLVPAYAGISYGRIEEDGGLQWPCLDLEHPGTPFLYARGFPRGKARCFAVEFESATEVPDDEYPLYLTTGRGRFHYHSGSMTHRSPGLEHMAPEERIEMHPHDAETLAVNEGDFVRITSRRGSVRARCTLTDRCAPGQVFATFHFSEVPINRLTSGIVDRDAKIPAYKECAVRVEKIVGDGKG